MNSDPNVNETPEPGRRREYEPPAVNETAEFETLAMTCGKVSGGACAFSPEGLTNS